MQLRIRQLISLIALATLVSVGACKQEKLPTDGQSPTRTIGGTIGGGTDQAALAETIVTVLFIARKQAGDSGECDQSEQRQDPRSGEDRALKRLLCDPLARQEAKGASSAQELRLKSIASLPKG
jgi:hypothetical protein